MGEKAKRVLNFAEFQDNFDDDKGETAGNTQQDVDMFANKADDFAKATMDDFSKMINISGTQQGKAGEEEEEAPEININIEAPDDEEGEVETGEDNEVKAPESEEDDEDDVPSYEEYAKKGEEESDEDDEEEEGEEQPKTEEPKEGEESEDDEEKANDVDLSELDDEKYSEQ